MTICVFQDWLFKLTMQQQSVLVLACRGPDGVGKNHPTKPMVARYRATVLKAAYLGRPMHPGEGDNTTFMTLVGFMNGHEMDETWSKMCETFFEYVDEIPHHYYMHLMHGAQIIGYKHPEQIFRTRWLWFYHLCCVNLHVMGECESEMDERLSDWHQQHWDDPIQAKFGYKI